jgi:hypothetical protein
MMRNWTSELGSIFFFCGIGLKFCSFLVVSATSALFALRILRLEFWEGPWQVFVLGLVGIGIGYALQILGGLLAMLNP